MPIADYVELNKKLQVALQNCAAGDQRAFQTIYELTAPKFMAIVTNQLKDAEAARDVVQQAYVSIWKNASKFDASKGQPFTWMLVIMRNRGLDRLRSKARAPETEMIEETLVDDAVRPEESTRHSHAGRLLAKHLSRLPQHVSMSISLNVIQGMSCTEIGKALDVSPNTVKGWIRRGLKKLRDDMPVSSVGAVI